MSLRNTLDQLAVATFVDRRSGQEVQGTFREKFEVMRKDIGKAFHLANEIRDASKRGVVALKRGDEVAADECWAYLMQCWDDLGTVDIPADHHWQHDSEAGQEMVEFIFARKFYPVLQGSVAVDEVKVPSHVDLKVSPQIWLAGMSDAATELSKMARDLLLNRKLTQAERTGIRERFLSIGKEIYDFLDQFETAYGNVINNSRRRGFGNTFRGAISRVSRVIEIHQEALIRHLDQETK